MLRANHSVASDSPAAHETAPEISFIIPTLNEERHIASTVSQFSQLKNLLHHEVIVADGGSSDKTVEIATKLGARTCINTAETRTIASNRNLGASIARGNILVFCDADTRIDNVQTFITSVLDAFRDEHLVGAVPRLGVFPEERIWKDNAFSALLNGCVRISFLTPVPFASGQCQIVRRRGFESVQGYNEHQVHGEDSGLFQKLAKVGRIRLLNDIQIFESPRRYRKLGYIRLIATGLYSTVGQLILRRNVLRTWERID